MVIEKTNTYRQRPYKGTNSNIHHDMCFSVQWDIMEYKHKNCNHYNSCIKQKCCKNKIKDVLLILKSFYLSNIIL